MATKVSYATKVVRIDSQNATTNYETQSPTLDHFQTGTGSNLDNRAYVLFKFPVEDIPKNLTTAALSTYSTYWTSGGSGYSREAIISALGADFTESSITYNTRGDTNTYVNGSSTDWEATSSSATKDRVYLPKYSYFPTYSWATNNLPNVWFTNWRDGIWTPGNCGIVSGYSHANVSSVSIECGYYSDEDATYKPYITYTYTPQKFFFMGKL
jgi:hypothetical protein